MPPARLPGEYSKWTQEQLIGRIQDLESQLKDKETIVATDTSAPNPATFTSFPIPSTENESQQIPFRKPPKQPPKAFDPSKYSTRLIALKFAYLGQKYNGFEHTKNSKTLLPTIEEEVWKALVKTRLISPIPSAGEERGDFDRIGKKQYRKWDREGADVNWDGCEYSKCGRTDKGVSAFGQVIGIRVRSNKPLPKRQPSISQEDNVEQPLQDLESTEEVDVEAEKEIFNDLQDELPYIQLLNNVLPPEIRIYAWCPKPPPNFSARFSCKERRYKYFFTNPCFAPSPGPEGLYSPTTTTESGQRMREGWLDIEKMREGCNELEGLHDFRNFCKIDASKQLTSFSRRIYHASIDEISPVDIPSFLSHQALQNPSAAEQPKMYAFTLHGSAFLWHQVRSIVAILFLIGQGLESPSLIPQLLDISTNPTRPKYEMASDAPLVLWDCIFPEESEVVSVEERTEGYKDSLNWVYIGDPGGQELKGISSNNPRNIGRGKWARGGIIDDVWTVWHEDTIKQTLSGLLLDTIASQGQSTLDEEGARDGTQSVKLSPRIFDGGDFGRAKGNYIPVMKRVRQATVEEVNERYAKRKGLDPTRTRVKVEDAEDADE